MKCHLLLDTATLCARSAGSALLRAQAPTSGPFLDPALTL